MLKTPDLTKPFFLFDLRAASRVTNGKCPECFKDIKESEFTDELSKREYSISGLCQECQDAVFDAPLEGFAE